MNREIRDEWVKRLRSGDYEQGTGRLRDLEDKYCCFGVLCEIAVDEKVISKPHTVTGGYIYGGLAAILPESVSKWSGMPEQWGAYDHTTLVTDNDSGVPFNEIANIIEAKF